jgi:putative peptidoglycan lipid II flippase
MAFIAIKIFAPIFLSRGDTKTPVKAGVVAMVSNIVLNLILVQYYDHVGLAAATSISALINAAILYFYLIKQSIFKFHITFYKMLVKVIFAVIIMALYIYYFDSSIELYLESSLLERSILISKTITISVILYFLTLYTLGVRLKQL